MLLTQKQIPPKKLTDYIIEPVVTVNGQKHLKKYKIIKKVGQGSYSQCYLVQTIDSNSTYVVKVIPKAKLEVLLKEKLVYQIKIQQMLSHHSVVHLDHSFEDQQYQYIFMENCQNGNLQTLSIKLKGFTQNDIKYYALQIVKSIEYIHSKNVLHRDLKLTNFYLDSNYNVKIGDFGFACQLAHPNQLKRQSCGTPNYIAPQALSLYGYSFTSDIWGIGVILYRMKFHKCPFEGPTIVETIQNVKLCRYTFPKNVKISEELKDLISKILIINYDERLTLKQIINHPFFQNIHLETVNKIPKDQGFSFKRFFSLGSKNNTGTTDKKQPQKIVRQNSCETFKQIKEIIKKKTSNPNFTQPNHNISQNNIHFKTQHYSSIDNRGLNLYTQLTSNRQQKTSIMITQRNNMKKDDVNFKTTYKLKHQIKKSNSRIRQLQKYQQQISLRHKPQFFNQNKSNPKESVYKFKGKYHLPYQIQLEKDIVIIHYQKYLKEIIYNHLNFFLFRNKNIFYSLQGDQVNINLPRVLKYVIENNVLIENIQEDDQPNQFATFSNGIKQQLIKIPKNKIINKEGIILEYNSPQLLHCVKIHSQQYFYIQYNNIKTMYNSEYQKVQGVVIERFYNVYFNSNMKKQKNKIS